MQLYHAYLKEQYYTNTKNYPVVIVAAATALITSFGAKSGRNFWVGGEDKDADTPVAIVSLHLAEDGSNNGITSSDDESIVG